MQGRFIILSSFKKNFYIFKDHLKIEEFFLQNKYLSLEFINTDNSKGWIFSKTFYFTIDPNRKKGNKK
jgi:hypothetical protein